ncbi:MAG TPA: CPBP family intramembrane glutamic endopeptidase [Candidatus Udaeobacter sp.]|nr:CPBP family intramembrane glutamic endopeptidase [Candidatus Udaeobacter sp.]
MKDAARLATYFIAIVILAALLAPLLFWSAQLLAAHGIFSSLARYDFDTFFDRAVLVAAVVLLWPLLCLSNIRRLNDLGIVPNPRWIRDLWAGVLLSTIPLIISGYLFIQFHVYSFRHVLMWPRIGKIIVAAICVPLIEETFFRGIVLGLLLRTGRKFLPIIAVSSLFAVVHFLKGPDRVATIVTWSSGFQSIAHAFAGLGEPKTILFAFATLFMIGCILADARFLTNSLWLPIGLHAGWIFASGTFSLLARRYAVALPWIGKNLLVGIVPLCLGAITWIVMRLWLKHDRASQV